MGYYIEVPLNQKKAEQLVRLHGATIIPQPTDFSSIPSTEALICVVSNGPFDAAGVAYDEGEFNAFLHPDGRPRVWLTIPRSKALELQPRLSNVWK